MGDIKVAYAHSCWVAGELAPPPPPVWQPVFPGSRKEMENTRNAQVGIEARRYERLILRLSVDALQSIRAKIINALASRCSKSGRCISDVYPALIVLHADCESLGCPGWCNFACEFTAPATPYKKTPTDEIMF